MAFVARPTSNRFGPKVAESRMSIALNGKTCRVEAATLSPAGKHLATCSEVKSMLGLWRQACRQGSFR